MKEVKRFDTECEYLSVVLLQTEVLWNVINAVVIGKLFPKLQRSVVPSSSESRNSNLKVKRLQPFETSVNVGKSAWSNLPGELNLHIYTGCPRRNVPDFGRVFLMLKYTDITQNTYIQS